MYYETMLKDTLEEQVLRAPAMKNAPAFYRRLEQSMDVARERNGLMTVKPRWPDSVVDMTTSDFLTLNRSGMLKKAFLEELEHCGDFRLGASGSRVQYGNYNYLQVPEVEREVAGFRLRNRSEVHTNLR